MSIIFFSKKIFCVNTQKNIMLRLKKNINSGTAKESDRELLRVYDKEVDLKLIQKQNLVLTVTTNKRLNLAKISQDSPECTRKQPDNLSAAVIRFQVPPDNKKTSCNIFTSGKLVITGAKNFWIALLCVHNTLRKIRKALCQDVKGVSISLKNIVMTMKVDQINLRKFSQEWRHCCTYNPSKFPGVIMSFPGTNKPVANVFKSGSIVIPGPHDKAYAIEATSYVYNIIRNYQITPKSNNRETNLNNMDNLLSGTQKILGATKNIKKGKPKKN